jgi:hypothetical protein
MNDEAWFKETFADQLGSTPKVKEEDDEAWFKETFASQLDTGTATQTDDMLEPGVAPEGVRDLTRDDVFDKIRPYMQQRFGMTEDKFERQEIVDAYVNNMRKFNFGQSVVTLGEMAYLKNAKDNEKAAAAAAYSTFDSMKGAFAEGTSGMEKLDAVYDYGRALIVDPINLVSLGIGKLLTGGATKAAVQVAKEAVKKEGTKILKKQGATKASKQAVVEVERKLMGKVIENQAVKGEGYDIAAGAFSQAMKGVATKEAVAVGVTDTVAGVSMDAVYQAAQQEVGLQTEYNKVQGSLAAAGGMFGVGLSVALSKLTRSGDPDTDMLSALMFDKANTQLAEARKLAGNVGQTIKDLDKAGFQDSLKGFKKGIEDFSEKVQRGSLMRLLGTGQRVPKETQIRKAFYLGDKETGVKGLVDILAENGVRNWTKRSDDDNFSNWMMDLVKAMPKKVRTDIDDAFRNTLGKAVPDYNGKSLVQALDMDAQAFSIAGQELNIVAQASKTLSYIPPGETDEMLAKLVDAELPGMPARMRKAFGEKTGYLQRNFIRMLVTHPGTTALNLIGWQNASVLQSATDVLRGTLYGGNAVVNTLMFNAPKAADYARKAGLMFSLQKQKMSNLLDPSMTYQAFLDFAAYNPEAGKKMFKYLSGGIELEEAAQSAGFTDFGKLAKEAGVEGADRLTSKPGIFEKAMDGLQTIYGVKAQDMLTKSQEFMYAIDKRMRVEYNVSYSEFINDPNLWSKMNGEKYAEVVATATDDALRNVFSKSYGGTEGPLQYVAKAIEDARKIPVIGAMVPFGQFFNNTMAHMMDYTGVSLAHKYLAGTTRDPMDLLTKSAIGMTFMGAMYAQEKEYLDEGLPLFTERSSDGALRNRTYDFPYSYYKAMGRMIAHVVRDGEVPLPLFQQFKDTFGLGQLTRQLGDSAKMAEGLILDIVTSEDPDVKGAAIKLVQSSAAMYASGYSRPLDPVNTIASLVKKGEYVTPDRKQGQEWLNNSVRYVDELLDAMDVYNKPEQKQTALTTSEGRVPILRLFGVREELAQSPIQEMYNQAGMPQWSTNIRSNIKEPLNDINRIITPILNYEASAIMEQNRWKDGDPETRKKLISTVISESKKRALEVLELSFDPDDRKSTLLYKLGQSSFIKKNDLRDLLKQMEIDDDLSKLTGRQLEMLIGYIELDKENKKTYNEAFE